MRFERLRLRIPKDRDRCYYVKAKVLVRYTGDLSRTPQTSHYWAQGEIQKAQIQAVA